MKALEGVKVGDEIVVVGGYNRSREEPRRETVVRVARKYLYIERYGQEIAYEIETGLEKHDRYLAASGAYTIEGYAEKLERDELNARFEALNGRHPLYTKVTNDQLRRIIAIIEEGA